MDGRCGGYICVFDFSDFFFHPPEDRNAVRTVKNFLVQDSARPSASLGARLGLAFRNGMGLLQEVFPKQLSVRESYLLLLEPANFIQLFIPKRITTLPGLRTTTTTMTTVRSHVHPNKSKDGGTLRRNKKVLLWQPSGAATEEALISL